MLLDSNIIIYSSQPAHQFLRKHIATINPYVSWISYLEVPGYRSLSSKDALYFKRFFKSSVFVEINFEVIEKATRLRAAFNLSLADSLIAASALLCSMPLVTRN